MTDDVGELRKRIAELEQQIHDRIAKDNTLTVFFMKSSNIMFEMMLYLNKMHGHLPPHLAPDHEKITKSITELFDMAEASIEGR